MVTDECKPFPSRTRLIKRVNKLALLFARNGCDLDNNKDKLSLENQTDLTSADKKKYGFCVIDQADYHNTLLAAMLKVQLSLKQGTKPTLIVNHSLLIFEEIDELSYNLACTDNKHPLILVLEKIKNDVQTYLNTIRRCPCVSKNILRAIVSVFLEIQGLIYLFFTTDFIGPVGYGACNSKDRICASVCVNRGNVLFLIRCVQVCFDKTEE